MFSGRGFADECVLVGGASLNTVRLVGGASLMSVSVYWGGFTDE